MLYFLLAAVLAALPGTPASTELAQVFAAGTAIGATMAISPIRASSTCSTSGRAGACRRPISRWRRQDHDLRHLARQARRAGRRRAHQFRSDRCACRGAEEAARAVLDELDRVSRMAGDDGLFHPRSSPIAAPSKRWATASATARSTRCSIPPCDDADPHSVPENATLYMKVPPKTASMQVQLTDVDGTTSPARSFNAPI